MENRQFITFYLGEDLFGLDILLVREINRHLELTRVDRAPDFVRGLMNLRGQIVTVLDLGIRLGIGARTIGPTSSCIVLKTRGELERYQQAELGAKACEELVGLLVDRIGDVIGVETMHIDPPPAHAGGVKGLFIEGVVQLQQQLMILLNIGEVLSAEESSRS